MSQVRIGYFPLRKLKPELIYQRNSPPSELVSTLLLAKREKQVKVIRQISKAKVLFSPPLALFPQVKG
jgi:hypothetical protein